MKLFRLLFAVAIAATTACVSAEAPGEADAVAITPIGDDLRDEARLAAERKLPILLMFSAEHCGYCVRVKEEFLKPMLISGDYEDRVLIRRVEMDRSRGSITDFDGRPISVDDLAGRYGVFVTPTLVFLDAKGRRTADNLVGLMTPDFFGGYIDQHIALSLERLRAVAANEPAHGKGSCEQLRLNC